MNIRLIAGLYGGRIIEGSGTNRTHPMSERIRNSLFNIIGDELNGAIVLDAFAGSGSLGLEALSRGAKKVVFIEKDRIAQKVINNNLKKLGIDESKAQLIKAPVNKVASTIEAKFDIIFADPPFHDPQFSTVEKLFSLLKPNGLMVLSYAGKAEVPTGTEVVVVDNRSYGNAALVFYRRRGAR
ncbi:16S rRNA (guanine(966)-N(2))-methyltransferase RsmD [Candidatus Saccharibacteria bacterium 32-49-12]|nr:MAG: 16S rRNA (guanine(966)-N(2))-methyltransferase RsmD [Candidatus Saccharibacteria bacterium 32-49-12]